jgi:dipeptidyl aminopeptidase/acylaminoacyl peptidase
VTADIPWNVEDGALSDDRRRAAFTVNEGGRSALYLLDPQTRKYARVNSIPVGLVGELEFSPDGNKLALTINTAKSPSDTYVLYLDGDALSYGKLERWTFSEVGGLDTTTFREPELIQYPTFDDVDGKPRQIPAWLYKPAGSGPFPVVISIHGGPEGQARPAFSSTYQLWLEKLGVAILVPNVRGSSGYGRTYVRLDNGFQREDSVKDIGALLDWIEAHPDLDQDRVAVFGGSYGGYMVLASAVHFSDRLRAAVDIVGISSFVTFLENTQDYRRDLRRVEYGDERDPEMRAHLEKISPVNSVEKINIPLFVVQGENDPRVPVTESIQMVAALREQGETVWYMNALNEGHGYRKKENRDIYQQATVLFLKTHLLGE